MLTVLLKLCCIPIINHYLKKKCHFKCCIYIFVSSSFFHNHKLSFLKISLKLCCGFNSFFFSWPLLTIVDLILTFQSPTRLSVSELTSDLEQVKTHSNSHWSSSLSALCLFYWIYRIDILDDFFLQKLGTVKVVPFLAF